MKAVTVKDVAASAGVSATTVSHALSGKGRVDPATRSRIVALAEEMGYKPNPAARALRTGRSRTIALVTSVSAADTGLEEEVTYFTDLAVAAARESLASGYALVLVPPLEQHAWLDVVTVDGVIVVFPRAGDSLLDAARRRRIPLVTVGRDHRRNGISAVVEDSDTIALLAFDHLLDRGCSRPALLVSRDAYGIDVDMRTAYEKWAADRGVPAQVFEAPSGPAEQAGFDLARQVLGAEPDFDGIFTPLDVLASGFGRGARALGLELPKDLKVVTTEGPSARYGEVPLTTVDFHPDVLVRRAVRTLIADLGGRSLEDVEPAVPALIRRQST